MFLCILSFHLSLLREVRKSDKFLLLSNLIDLLRTKSFSSNIEWELEIVADVSLSSVSESLSSSHPISLIVKSRFLKETLARCTIELVPECSLLSESSFQSRKDWRLGFGSVQTFLLCFSPSIAEKARDLISQSLSEISRSRDLTLHVSHFSLKDEIDEPQSFHDPCLADRDILPPKSFC